MITFHHLGPHIGNFGRSKAIIFLNQNMITYWNLVSISENNLLLHISKLIEGDIIL